MSSLAVSGDIAAAAIAEFGGSRPARSHGFAGRLCRFSQSADFSDYALESELPLSKMDLMKPILTIYDVNCTAFVQSRG